MKATDMSFDFGHAEIETRQRVDGTWTISEGRRLDYDADGKLKSATPWSETVRWGFPERKAKPSLLIRLMDWLL